MAYVSCRRPSSLLVFVHLYVVTKESGNQFFFKSTNIMKVLFDSMLISTAYAGLLGKNRKYVNMMLHGLIYDFPGEGQPQRLKHKPIILTNCSQKNQTAWKQTKKYRVGASLALAWLRDCSTRHRQRGSSRAYSAIHKAAGATVSRLAWYYSAVPLFHWKMSHRLWMGAGGRSGLWRQFCTAAGKPVPLWIALFV